MFNPGMDHRIVALIGPKDWTSSVGKRTSETSFSTFNLKRDDSIVSLLEPSKFPEKIWSLLFCLYLADEVFLLIDRIDRDLGEVLISLDLAEKHNGRKGISDGLEPTLVNAILKDNPVERYPEFDPDPGVLREYLHGLTVRDPSGPSRIAVDQSFNVKGVGCVVLGFVVSGSVHRHQEVIVHPGGKRTVVRSIQIHDRDHESAPNGARVGLALKNIDPEDIPRGSMLASTDDDVMASTVLHATMRTSRLWKEGLRPGARMHLWSGLQFEPCTVKEAAGTGPHTYDLTVETDAPVWSIEGGAIGLVHLDSKSFRLIASGKTILR